MTTASERPLGTSHVASVVIGAIIGVGIFFTPAGLARALPSPGWVLALWLLGGLVSVVGALVYAELSGRFPLAGGVYVFLREGLGPLGRPAAFLYGWMHLAVVQPGAMAVIALVLVDHVAFLFGPMPPGLRTISAVAAVATFTLANLAGLRTGGRLQLVMAALKVGALAALIAVGALYGDASTALAPRSEAPSGTAFSWIVVGLIPILFSFGGAYHGTFIGGSVRNPERSIPRGIVLGVAIVLIGYVAVNYAFLSLLGHDGLAASDSPAADAAKRALGARAGDALALVIVLSAAGVLNTVCLGFPFVVFAMAKDRLFFAPFARLSPRTGRPALAVLLQGSLACLALLVGSSRVDVLLTGIAFADAVFQCAVGVAQLRVRRQRAAPEVLRAPLAAGLLFLALSLVIAAGTLIERPVESVYGALALGVGLATYRLWGKP